MGDAKQRKHLGIKPDLKGGRKKHVMKRAKSEPIRPGFLSDFGRDLASTGQDSMWCCMEISSMIYMPLSDQPGIAAQVVPSILSCRPSSDLTRHTIIADHILTIECLSKEPVSTLFEYIKQQLIEGVTLRVGYDRAYQGSDEYVVPLILEYK